MKSNYMAIYNSNIIIKNNSTNNIITICARNLNCTNNPSGMAVFFVWSYNTREAHFDSHN